MPVVTRLALHRCANRLQNTYRRRRASRPVNAVCPFTLCPVDAADQITLVSEPSDGVAPGVMVRITASLMHEYVRGGVNRNPFTNAPLNEVELARLQRAVVGKAARRTRWDRPPTNASMIEFMDAELGDVIEIYMGVAEVADFETCHAHMLAETIHGIQSTVVQFARVDTEACIRAIDHAVTVCEGPPGYARHRHVQDPRSITMVVGLLKRFRQAFIPVDADDTDDADEVEVMEEVDASDETAQRV